MKAHATAYGLMEIDLGTGELRELFSAESFEILRLGKF